MNDQLNEVVTEGMKAVTESNALSTQASSGAGKVMKFVKYGATFIGGVFVGIVTVFGGKKAKAKHKAKVEAKKAAEEANAETEDYDNE